MVQDYKQQSMPLAAQSPSPTVMQNYTYIPKSLRNANRVIDQFKTKKIGANQGPLHAAVDESH